MIEEVKTLNSTSINNLRSLLIGEKSWGLLERESQSALATAETSFQLLREIKGIDFSVSIMPLMKTLEAELIANFYIPYMEYIRKKFKTPEEYLKYNGICDPAQKVKILEYNEKSSKLSYVSLTGKTIVFTIANYSCSIMTGKLKDYKFDKSVIDFYQENIFGSSADKEKIKSWLKNLVNTLESLRMKRNQSAHSGYNPNSYDAETVRNLLFAKNHTLIEISNPKSLFLKEEQTSE